jgi:hypothetical protein
MLANMAHPNRRKGSAAELAVAKWLNANGFPQARRAASGWADDRGDIDGVPELTVEVKNEKRIDLPGYIRELEAEMMNRDTQLGVVVVKRRGSSDPDDWYAVLPGWLWMKMAGLLYGTLSTEDACEAQDPPLE